MEQQASSFKSLFRAMAITALLVIGVIWVVNTLSNGDPLWFLPYFGARADRITIYWDGEVRELKPGDADYEAVMTAAAEAIGTWKAYENRVTLSPESLQALRTKWRMVELHFAEPVVVHTRHIFPPSRTLFLPLTGPHASYRRLFGAVGEVPTRAGALIMSEAAFAHLTQTLEAVMQ